MLGIVYGKTGSGKSEWVFSQMESYAACGHVFLLVPDREAVAAESRAAELASAQNIDVVTFTRLCNYIFRRYGGLCVDYIGSGAKKLMMRNVIRALAPSLKEYGVTAGFGIYEKMTSLRTEFYQDKIFPSDLDEVSGALGEDTPLGAKAKDLSLIFSAFDAEVASRFEDPDGMLSRASALLSQNDFFEGSTVFVDSFSSFSVQQYDILTQMMRGAENVFVTMPYLPEESEASSVRCLAWTDRRLRLAANRAGIRDIRAICLREPRRYCSSELAFLSSEIAGGGTSSAVWQEKPRDIRLVRAVNSFAEAEAVATDICRAVREGVRYREIAVIVRETSSYEGILDAVFRKYEIPYFLSSKKNISEKPLIKLIFSAFAVCERGFRGEDVIAYIKTGYASITADEICLFENYIVKWNLRGKLFTSDEPWNMHPRGYGMSYTGEDTEKLRLLSDIRRRVIGPLKAFSAVSKTVSTVRERATLLFDFLSGLSVPEFLSAKAEEEKQRGELSLAAETVQLWNVFCGALDQLVVSSGDTEASASEFSQMLSMILLETDIGKIPTSVDEVTISGAAQTIPGHHRYVYLVGAEEGNFPQRVSEKGLFSEYEKSALAAHGIEITNRMERRVSEELYYFYRAATLPSERLHISFAHHGISGGEQRESVGVKRIRKLFPNLVPEDFESFGTEKLIESRSASFERATAADGNLGRALREYYEADEAYAEKLKYMKTPLSARNCVLSPEHAEALFPGKLRTSYSRLERFIKCRFAYFCEYELKLRDYEPAVFGAVDIGSFMHGVLEKTVEWIAKNGEGDLEEKVGAVARDYIAQVFRMSAELVPKRLGHLFRYLCRSAVLFAEKIRAEMTVSSFRPKDFELVIGREGDAVRPLRLESDGVTVELRGKIDRVDAFEDGEGKLYLRVVDYKTGEKTFDIRNVKLGLDTQMLLYLFSLWENGERRYGKEVFPAGVLYAGIKPPQKDVRIGEESETVEASVQASGLFLKNEEILRAMDPALKGEWIPVKESDLKKEKPNILGLDALQELKRDVTETVLQYASELKSGVAHARPLASGGRSPCEYCKMRSVCRAKK